MTSRWIHTPPTLRIISFTLNHYHQTIGRFNFKTFLSNQVTNYNTDWNDGLALAALIDLVIAGFFDQSRYKVTLVRVEVIPWSVMEYRTAIFLSIFQKTFLEKNVEKKLFHLFFLNFFNFISEKKVKIFFFSNIFFKNVFWKIELFFKH